MRTERCQNCGSRNPKWTERFPDTALLTCSACDGFSFFGALTKSPEELYGKNYFETDEYVNYEAHANVHQLNFRRKYRILEPFFESAPNIFEVGCAYGFFLEQAKLLGVKNFYGIDVNPEIVARAQERVGSQHAGLAGERATMDPNVNSIVAWDVWEHLEEPYELFEKYCGALRAGGIVAVTTLDSGARIARQRGLKWRQIHPPTHLHYPNKKGLRMALESLGFDVVYQRPFGYYRALQIYASAFGISFSNTSAIARLPLYLNLYDTQLVVGKKR